jgi:hypothetical protein
MATSEQYIKAVRAIDLIYQNETATELSAGITYPKEYLYARRMVEMLTKFYPQADEAQLLAARCQHFCRWEIPRSSYPLDKKGYHTWRTFLYTYQAQKAAEILLAAGYDDETVERVRVMVSKQGIKVNADTQLIEDVICLVFIQYYVEEFSHKYADDIPKLFDIIQKTWRKMSDAGHAAVLQLQVKPELMDTLKAALSAE